MLFKIRLVCAFDMDNVEREICFVIAVILAETLLEDIKNLIIFLFKLLKHLLAGSSIPKEAFRTSVYFAPSKVNQPEDVCSQLVLRPPAYCFESTDGALLSDRKQL